MGGPATGREGEIRRYATRPIAKYSMEEARQSIGEMGVDMNNVLAAHSKTKWRWQIMPPRARSVETQPIPFEFS